MTVEQAVTWAILFAVLGAIGSGRFRMEVVALGGLLLLGLSGIAPVGVVFFRFRPPGPGNHSGSFLYQPGHY